MTLKEHHTKAPRLTTTRVDAYLPFKRSDKIIYDITNIQIEETFRHGIESFLTYEKFYNKTKKRSQSWTICNGTLMKFEKYRSYSLSRKEKLEGLQPVNSKKVFLNSRAKSSFRWCSVQTLFACCYAATQLISSGGNDPIKEDIKYLNKIIKYCKYA